MPRLTLPPLAVLLLAASAVAAPPSTRFEHARIRMGVDVRVVLYADDAAQAEKAALAVFDRFDALNAVMSDYDSDSELNRLSRRSDAAHAASGQAEPIPVGDELFEVLKAARRYGELSDGAFDITVAPYVRLWRRARRQRELPKQRLLDQARERVGRELWELDEERKTVRLLRPGMRFDLGGIAKGYALDRALETIRAHGIRTCLVDAGGDLRAGDAPPGGWKIDLSGGGTLRLENAALATSGDALRFLEIDGVRYSHIIDPKTGLGLTRSSLVVVDAPTAMEADALASAVSVLGPEKGLKLIERLPQTSARITVDGREFRSTRWNATIDKQ